MKKGHLTYVQALSWVVGSSLVFAPLAHKGIRYYFAKKYGRAKRGLVEYVVQTGVHKEALDSIYFCELLGLSLDSPTLFKEFNTEKAESALLKSPLIYKVLVKKIKPNMVYIDYALRRPVARAGDFYNAAVDKEGVLLPMHPFFSPKRLPELYLGEANREFGESISGKRLDLALAVLEAFPLDERGGIVQIDVSKAFEKTLGTKEVVVAVEEEVPIMGGLVTKTCKHFLRLSTRGYPKEIENYLRLRPHLQEAERQEVGEIRQEKIKEITVDLRLAQFAFVE